MIFFILIAAYSANNIYVSMLIYSVCSALYFCICIRHYRPAENELIAQLLSVVVHVNESFLFLIYGK